MMANDESDKWEQGPQSENRCGQGTMTKSACKANITTLWPVIIRPPSGAFSTALCPLTTTVDVLSKARCRMVYKSSMCCS